MTRTLFQTRYLGRPVLSLQTMLRTISFQYSVIPRLIPDGVFGEDTLEAVMIFQREFFPPVTGRVDQPVWAAVVRTYEQSLQALDHPAHGLFPNGAHTVQPGARSIHLAMAHGMFQALSAVLEGITPGGNGRVHSPASAANVRWLQHVSGQPETGVMDQGAWDTLERIYAIFVSPRSPAQRRTL